MHALLRFLLHALHVLLWGTGALACILFILFCIAAYGIPGRWLTPRANSLLAPHGLTLSVDRVAYLPLHGLQLKGVVLRNGKKERLLSFSSGTFDLILFKILPWEKRLTAVTIEDLFVAQIEHDPNKPVIRKLPPPELRRPPLDFTHILLPELQEVSLRLYRANVLEIRADTFSAQLSTTPSTLTLSDLHLSFDSREQHCEGNATLDLHRGFIDAHLRGFLFQKQLYGLWNALDFPILRQYSDNFTLNSPAWGDCTFVVGLDKYRNIFNLSLDVVLKNGSYCNVPFDEATATITCRGIWDAVTTITPIVVRRKGVIAAQGSLIFDTDNDQFHFQAETTGFQPDDCLRLIDMPFTETLPVLVGTTPPNLTIRGRIPLYAEQTPDSVFLNGNLSFPDGGTLHAVPVKSASATLSMEDGTFTVSNFSADFADSGTLHGNATLKLPQDASYTDLSTQLYLEKTPLASLLSPLDITAPENAALTGFLNLQCRTDDTFADSLQAAYSLTVDGGLITRLPLFAGLTDLLADNIPGISSLTDSSTAKLVGTADAGLFTLPEFSLTGDILSIEGPVSYDLKNDLLLAQITAGNFKRGTLLGTLTRWVTIPLNKLIWQVKVTGPLAEPDWEIVTIVEGLWHKAREYNPFANPKSSDPEK